MQRSVSERQSLSHVQIQLLDQVCTQLENLITGCGSAHQHGRAALHAQPLLEVAELAAFLAAHLDRLLVREVREAVENRPEAHSVHIMPPRLLSVSVTNPAPVHAMHSLSEVAAN